ncbi:MAG: hypothetical protein RMI56_04860 [Sulfolobales archaeon]|nr:hypothetical protein [Sulfolobales archaeon]MDW8083114.1 hypothetical protein [Sulfolobales archaeon]
MEKELNWCGSMDCGECSWLWSTWVKAPILANSDLLIASACLPVVNPELFKQLSSGRTVLLACPERENPTHYGKIASIIRSSRPRRITIATIDGSPHCFMLHASANEAEYIVGEKIDKEHFVVVNGKQLVRISPHAVRVARYLSIVNEVLEKNPEIVERLTSLSKEYRAALNLSDRASSYE